MSFADSSITAAQLGDEDGQTPPTRWGRFESLLTRVSERLNPILVKEARQALRSKQFVTTFMLMLAAGWVWSMLGLAALGPGVYYSADGPTMFYGYYFILTFPLLVVAPYTAFHSLSAERQDRTHELVSITTLNPRQILSGKLGSIVLQMVVYLSAIFPCLAFTYLLRGLEIFTVIWMVAYTSMISLGLSAIGLCLAALPPQRQRQIGNAVLFAVLLSVCFVTNISTAFWMVSAGGASVDSPYFWIQNLAWLTFYGNCFALVFLSARSQLMTVCQNRSTDLRIALVVAQMSLLAWCAYSQMVGGGNAIFGFVFFTTLLWWVAGMFLTGEPTVLSPRVKRDLPQSTVGRIFLSWFAPGPATGLMFVTANVIAAFLMFNLPFDEIAANVRPVPVTMGPVKSMGVMIPSTVITPSIRPGLWEVCVIAASYLIVYLGVGKLILSMIRRFTQVQLTTRVLVHICLLMFGAGVPWSIQMTVPSLRTSGYTLLQITNPVWTITESCFKGVPVVGPVLVYTLPIAALIVLGLNMPSLVAELKQVRIAKPPRVAEDDAEMAAPLVPTRTSPWDEAAVAE